MEISVYMRIVSEEEYQGRLVLSNNETPSSSPSLYPSLLDTAPACPRGLTPSRLISSSSHLASTLGIMFDVGHQVMMEAFKFATCPPDASPSP